VRELRAEDITEPVDVICGGYPCQPFSLAGKRGGETDDRHLWPEYLRLIREIRPAWVVAENVIGHVSMGLDQVLFDLENENYACWTFIIPACAVNAPHRRDRVWIVANNRGERAKRIPALDENKKGGAEFRAESSGDCETFTNADRPRLQAPWPEQQTARAEQYRKLVDAHSNGERLKERHAPAVAATAGYFARSNFESLTSTGWITQPGVCQGNDGVSGGVAGRIAKLKALGNSVVPQIPEIIGRAILEVHNGNLD